jgi:alpha-beta hydrolase superfamily lysophospholipase
MTGMSKDPNTRGEIVSFQTSDGVRLHGALYTNGRARSDDIAVIGTHGAASNFYTSVVGFLSPALPSHGYPTLAMNLRCHDRFYATSIFEDCEKDLAAGVRFMKEQGYSRIILFGHSLSVTQILYYMARSQEASVIGLALSAGHDDLRAVSWTYWDTLVDDPKAEYNRVLAHCRELVAQGDGDRLIIIPWWRPDPKLKLRQTYRETSAQTFVSYRSPESNCNASVWMPQVRTPMLLIAHSKVDTAASPDMMKRLQQRATNATSTDYLEIQGAGHFYVGYEDQLTDAVVGWIDKLRGAGSTAGAQTIKSRSG